MESGLTKWIEEGSLIGAVNGETGNQNYCEKIK